VAHPLTLEVPDELDGERLDRAVAVLLAVSRAVARSLVEQGVFVDGVPGRVADRVRAGSVVVTPLPGPATALRAEPVDFVVIHEDPALIVVDKPPGLVVHPGSGRQEGTLAAGLLHRYPELEGVGIPGRWGLVHRLDRDTSGVLIVGRTQHSYDVLSSNLARRRIGRTYAALVHGTFATQTGTIDAPIGRDPTRPTRRAVLAGGKPAVTHYEVVNEYPEQGLSLIDVRLETGRTHQIRVHMAAIGHPVLGDSLYSALNARITSPRVFLHARRVELDHPETGEPVAYEAPLPADLAGVLDTLGTMASG
jgi:23S rRNA pseudouridine1911/1915/1917 synthase